MPEHEGWDSPDADPLADIRAMRNKIMEDKYRIVAEPGTGLVVEHHPMGSGGGGVGGSGTVYFQVPGSNRNMDLAQPTFQVQVGDNTMSFDPSKEITDEIAAKVVESMNTLSPVVDKPVDKDHVQINVDAQFRGEEACDLSDPDHKPIKWNDTNFSVIIKNVSEIGDHGVNFDIYLDDVWVYSGWASNVQSAMVAAIDYDRKL